MDRAGCNAGQANNSSSSNNNNNNNNNNQEAKRNVIRRAFAHRGHWRRFITGSLYCATLPATMTGTCTVDMVLIKQPAVESWNQMPQWDEKALTGRNVDDLVLSYLVWSHLALPYAHGMKNKQERRENSQKPGTVSAAAAGADAVCSALLCSVATCLRIFIRAIIVVAIFVT
ncbi:hypothetical protein T4A_4828 [Trichinella pseudospiralis]|uniref:Uncharacterized protein n=1 Tax=Trichinella pseudospiralis TaxID=6337 RepID=A0A0V1DU08_TRIPS|nr:hypothetical protein T4A_4828 [Trichinella pseudospiralis]